MLLLLSSGNTNRGSLTRRRRSEVLTCSYTIETKIGHNQVTVLPTSRVTVTAGKFKLSPHFVVGAPALNHILCVSMLW